MSSRNLLVVDADPAVHDRLSHLLARGDRRIQDAYDGEEALEKIRSLSYDLVLAGQGSNGLGGVKLLRKVRALRPETKVIVAGDQDPQLVVGAIRYRAYSYFHKPLAESPLVEMVTQALESDSWKDDIKVVSARADWISLDVRCKLEAAERTAHFLRELQVELPAHIREDIAVAFRELLMNAIEHGGKHDPKKRVRASVIRTPGSIIVHIHDPGQGFDLDFLPHAAISNPEDSPTRHVELRADLGKRPGGFGILMTRNLVDELVYNERGNAVLFVKYLK